MVGCRHGDDRGLWGLLPRDDCRAGSRTVLMLLGIGFAAILTANIAAYFFGSDEDVGGIKEDLARLDQRLGSIEKAIRKISGKDDRGGIP